MSSEGENTQEIPKETKESVSEEDKNGEDSQPNKKSKIENDADKKEDAKVPVVKENAEKKENDTKKEKPEEEPEKAKNEAKPDSVDSKKATKSEDEEGSEKEEEEGEDDDDDDDKKDDKEVPLLDQPLEQSGPRERKKVQRFTGNKSSDSKEPKEKEKEVQVKSDVGGGCGVELGEIPRIDASISRFKNDDLKLLHRLIFKTPGKTTIIKKNIKKFNGFEFKKDSDDYTKKIESTKKFELKQLKIICEMLDLDKKGTKDEIVERVVDFLLEPKDSGKPAGGGRPKRTAAVRANNIGYSSHDDSYSSDEQRSSRTTRGKGRRTNLKDDTTSESDFRLSDVSEDKPRVVKRKRVGRKKAAAASDDDDEDDVSDVNESATSEDSDEEPKKRKKGNKKITNNSKTKTTPKTRGRKPAAESEKKTPAKRGRKREETSEDSEQDEEENASSSEDEPLIKKAKSPQPPTDDEIKKYVKEILDGANLEEITMKTVCKQVYAHYPDFDLAHKKDFIKSTVKSLIST